LFIEISCNVVTHQPYAKTLELLICYLVPIQRLLFDLVLGPDIQNFLCAFVQNQFVWQENTKLRAEIDKLKAENKKLIAENNQYKVMLAGTSCSACGASVVPGEASSDEHRPSTGVIPPSQPCEEDDEVLSFIYNYKEICRNTLTFVKLQIVSLLLTNSILSSSRFSLAL
jgi:hypothetical protein